jgi:hypothetical protein
MAKEVFDQAQPRSSKAQRFADAFVGCDEWTVPPRKRREREEEMIFDVQSIRIREARTDLRRAA